MRAFLKTRSLAFAVAALWLTVLGSDRFVAEAIVDYTSFAESANSVPRLRLSSENASA